MAINHGFIVEFVLWFEQTYPGEHYRLRRTEDGTSIVRANGQTISFLDFYQQKLTAEWRPAGENQQSKHQKDN